MSFGSEFASHFLQHRLLLDAMFSQSILFCHCHLLLFDVPRHFAHEAAILALQRIVLTLNRGMFAQMLENGTDLKFISSVVTGFASFSDGGYVDSGLMLESLACRELSFGRFKLGLKNMLKMIFLD